MIIEVHVVSLFKHGLLFIKEISAGLVAFLYRKGSNAL